ncbi:efflux RND transporter periplasmic adaptor subunit [Phaeobacter sp. HF9A]|uniref:efflux RND transporter periplasmic adaptor subunit n=1 Tax=Phaeobacter sp. HF9A TaxID=2721561 RepID=UPI001431595E|nr:efflux RND transporter periplasmic adaptor subunit [Phaeobacter sp. HF9A]NIZ13557.1 efflux RND transporter periplasmic adaptor subunit [Phaeobacter sp. HF9A]
MTDDQDLETRLRSLKIDRTAPAPGARAQHRGGRGRLLSTTLALALIAGLGAVAGVPGLRQQVQTLWAELAPMSGQDARSLAAVQPANPPTPAAPTTTAVANRSSTGSAAPQASVAVPAPRGQSVVGSGYVVAPRWVVLQSPIGGEITRVDVQIGQPVQKNQELAWLDTGDAERALATAEADVALARSQVALSRAELAAAEGPISRMQKLVEKGVLGQAELADARLDAAVLQQTVVVRTQQLRVAQVTASQARANLERLVIRAPFDAVVVERHAVPGLLVGSAEQGSAEPEGLLTLVDIRTLFVDVDVAERNISAITPGQPAEVQLDAWPDRPLTAEVTAINPRAAREKGTITVRLKLTDADLDGVLPEMAAKVRFSAPYSVSSILPSEIEGTSPQPYRSE